MDESALRCDTRSGRVPVAVRAAALAIALALTTSGCVWTIRASVDDAGVQGNSVSVLPSLSGDGRFVAFTSGSSNLVDDDTNGLPDVFVRDNQTGSMQRVSVASNAEQSDGSSDYPSISEDGRYVAFSSLASNLVPGDMNGAPDVFVHDRLTGVTESISTQQLGGLRPVDISADGRFVVYPSQVPAQFNVVDRDTDTTEGISTPFGTGPEASISDDGRYVAFSRATSNVLVQNSAVFDRQTSTEVASFFNTPRPPVISGNGRFVVLTRLIVVGPNQELGGRVTVFDQETRAEEIVSVTSSETELFGSHLGEAISDDGRFIVFSSFTSSFVPDDRNGKNDAYVRDRVAGNTFLAVRNATGRTAELGSDFGADISDDGRYVAFQSPSSDLVAGDTNGMTDIFVRANPQPAPSAVAPGTVARGTTTTVQVLGEYLLADAAVSVVGSGVAVDAVTWVSDSELQVTLTIAPDADTGQRLVSVSIAGTGPGNAAGAIGVCSCLTVT
jgi:Tol biopolymer transport system component